MACGSSQPFLHMVRARSPSCAASNGFPNSACVGARDDHGGTFARPKSRIQARGRPHKARFSPNPCRIYTASEDWPVDQEVGHFDVAGLRLQGGCYPKNFPILRTGHRLLIAAQPCISDANACILFMQCRALARTRRQPSTARRFRLAHLRQAHTLLVPRDAQAETTQVASSSRINPWYSSPVVSTPWRPGAYGRET